MSLAELLLKIDNQYSGHYQTVINGLTLEQGITICKELEEYTDKQYSFVLERRMDSLEARAKSNSRVINTNTNTISK